MVNLFYLFDDVYYTVFIKLLVLMVKGGGGRVYTHTNTDTGRYMYVYTYIRGRWQKVRKRVGCFEINENTST